MISLQSNKVYGLTDRHVQPCDVSHQTACAFWPTNPAFAACDPPPPPHTPSCSPSFVVRRNDITRCHQHHHASLEYKEEREGWRHRGMMESCPARAILEMDPVLVCIRSSFVHIPCKSHTNHKYRKKALYFLPSVVLVVCNSI